MRPITDGFEFGQSKLTVSFITALLLYVELKALKSVSRAYDILDTR